VASGYQLFQAVLNEERAADGTEEGQRKFDLALGRFLSLWVSLERKLQSLTGKRPSSSSARLLHPSLDQYGVQAEDQEEIHRLRSIRNQLVHGQILLPASEIENAANRIATLIERLKD